MLNVLHIYKSFYIDKYSLKFQAMIIDGKELILVQTTTLQKPQVFLNENHRPRLSLYYYIVKTMNDFVLLLN